MKKFKRTMPLQEVTEYNPISRAYDWQENPVEKADSKCTVSTQKKPLNECDDRLFHHFSYSQQENLVEPDDIDFKVPARKVQQIEHISFAVEHASSRAKAVIRIDRAFFNKLKNTYAQAYILYMNGNAKNAKRCNIGYLKGLYYRSVEAGARLHADEKECQQAVSALQRSSSGESALIDSVAKCQSMIAKLRISVWENAHMLKIYIRESGAEGRAWFNALEKKHNVKYVR